MAIGFPASYSTTVELDVPRDAARVGVRYALELLSWKFENAERDTFRAWVRMSGMSWGERVEISIETPGVLNITSRCYPLQLIDWGKNRSNVEQFVKIFEAKAARDNKLPKPDPQYFDSDGKTPTERALSE